MQAGMVRIDRKEGREGNPRGGQWPWPERSLLCSQPLSINVGWSRRDLQLDASGPFRFTALGFTPSLPPAEQPHNFSTFQHHLSP